MLSAVSVAVGYIALVAAFGVFGVAAVLVHCAIMLVATARKRKDDSERIS